MPPLGRRFCFIQSPSERPVKNDCHEQIHDISPKKKADFVGLF
ncbi:hypothetical protein B4113_2418 [Geobacillus sp. B4113_201601]|nr:hypothetical protein B4113_2418 [Geobacillus sp. B4113_201601]